MIWPVQTRVPGVNVQVWNSCRDRIPGNFLSRKVFSKEMSTFPAGKSSKNALIVCPAALYLG